MSNINISKTGIYLIFLLILFITLFRFVLPFSDEPDFIWQSYELFNYNNNKYSPYYYITPLVCTVVALLLI